MPSTDLEPVRFSHLKLMGKSAAHFKARVQSDTSYLRKGSALHSYVLGDPTRVAVYEEGKRDKRVKAYQAFLEEHPNADILNPKEFAVVDGMRKSLEAHPRAMELLEGIREERIYWRRGSRDCAGTPDVVKLLSGGRKRVVELKSAQSTAPELLKWQAKKMGYHAQLSWYGDGIENSLVYPPGPVEEYFIVAVESAFPYPVTVIDVDPSMILKGAKQWRFWFEQLMVCEQTGHFPAYVESDVLWVDDDTELEWDPEVAA